MTEHELNKINNRECPNCGGKLYRYKECIEKNPLGAMADAVDFATIGLYSAFCSLLPVKEIYYIECLRCKNKYE